MRARRRESGDSASLSERILTASPCSLLALLLCRGKHAPKPIATWDQTGLPDPILRLLEARGYAAPFAIQRQALPIIMSGRDVIGVAKTGSGKTLGGSVGRSVRCNT